MTWVKLAEYAEQLDVSVQAVRKAIAEGRIKAGAKKRSADETPGQSGRPGWWIDPEVANREWGKNTAPQKRHSEAIKAGRQRQLNGGGESDGGGGYRGPSMNQAQTIKAGYQAKLLALEYEERSGQLVRADEVRRQQFEAGRRVRDAVLRIGPQMIGEIAKAAGGLSAEQRAEVLLVIERYQVKALEGLADGAGDR
ncbi:MAG: hypothetical protein RLZZ516_1191 [Cyanobacteriota bacterium]|jgi:hypothetical protein|nr:hypothetical protein [Gemmatimonadaceae bacterium]